MLFTSTHWEIQRRPRFARGAFCFRDPQQVASRNWFEGPEKSKRKSGMDPVQLNVLLNSSGLQFILLRSGYNILVVRSRMQPIAIHAEATKKALDSSLDSVAKHAKDL